MNQYIKKSVIVVLFLVFYSCGTQKGMLNSNYKDYKLMGKVGKVELWGGDGLSFKTAIWIKNAKSSMEGIPAE